MPFTLAQLDALDAAIAQGTTQVTYGNKIVMYKSFEEMVKTRNLMLRELGLSATVADGRKFAEFDKGLNNHRHECD